MARRVVGFYFFGWELSAAADITGGTLKGSKESLPSSASGKPDDWAHP
jgi:hypothetical protein